ncbi:MAG: M23 family metallopeptidase [Gemmiger sp.]
MAAHQAGGAETADLHQSRPRQDSIVHFKPTTRKKPCPAPPPKTAQAAAKKAADASRPRKKAAKAAQRAKQAAQSAKETAKKVADAVMAGLKALWAATHTMAMTVAAGGTVALLVIVMICMIALVIGSAFGIFFAAEPTGDGMSLTDAITQLNGEYQDRLEEIETTVPHDRQEIESNDGSYAIAWQDVLAVFAARTSGAKDGASVAYLDEANLDRLRDILWDMNRIDYQVETQTHEVETAPSDDGQEDADADNVDENEDDPATTTVTETVLILTLTHKTADEMRTEYAFNDRQNEYLTLLSAEDVTPLWGELLGGFSTGSGEIMTPGSDASLADGALQWPLPVAGTITSPQGYRTDPITGETSYHSGTDIAAPEGTPILAAADGTVTVANALDRWGGSYGYYVKLDHGGGLTTLYAHCSSICVTAGQQVQAGEVIAYAGQTGRATGPHLHFEVHT